MIGEGEEVVVAKERYYTSCNTEGIPGGEKGDQKYSKNVYDYNIGFRKAKLTEEKGQ